MNFTGVSFSSPDNGWAVGDRLGGHVPAGVHWDGVRWKPAKMPVLPFEGYLRDVAVFSKQQAWAVGTHRTDAGFRTLMLSWDGERWTKVPSPNPDAHLNELYGVTAVSADDAWAVGSFGRGRSSTLVVHWDGDSWTRVAAPNPDHDSYLLSVSAVSADDVWAAGDSFVKGAVVLHWEGESWRRVKIPGARDFFLSALTTDAQGEVWAVGSSDEYWPPYERTLIEHWDGSGWERVPSPNPSHRYNWLHDVDVAGPDDVWAVGGYLVAQGIQIALTLHWDGTSWTTVPVSQPPERNDLDSVAALGADDAWAVGEHDPKGRGGSQRCLIEHWDGTSWNRQR
jgi:hypothetical protein